MRVEIAEVAGRCRWCQCTHEEPCLEGCSWANRAQTLCSECVWFDRLMRSRAGRRELAIEMQVDRNAEMMLRALNGSKRHRASRRG